MALRAATSANGAYGGPHAHDPAAAYAQQPYAPALASKYAPTNAAPAAPPAAPVPAAAKPAPEPTKKADKPVPPTPPLFIRDAEQGKTYRRTGFLGEGGFARVFEVFDDEQERKAIKVVHKASIKSTKNKTKLWAEIKLHSMLDHPNVVHFESCFEDDENVYMLMELCEGGSLMDVLRRRKRYTEPEARYLLTQLIGACSYMHQESIIHRDLKLGNLFLDGAMNVKVGDFGLAALIENPGERKKTICGTPNYIAPEVLFDQASGHSFEVDIWSVGVILYTLLIGKPPFQTKDVKAIYRRIRENKYEFPPDKEISESAKNLIWCILNRNPEDRPSLDDILSHPWFTDGPFPSYIPSTANDTAPDWSHLTSAENRRNFASIKRRAFGQPQTTTPPQPPRTADLATSVLAQEKNFQDAVQPDSPISALLNSARKPLVKAGAPIKEPSLLRKLTAAGAQSTLSPVRRGTALRHPPPGAPSKRPEMDEVVEEEEEEEEVPDEEPRRGYQSGMRDREVAAQKARIVSQMAGMRISEPEQTAGPSHREPRQALSETNVQRHDPKAASSRETLKGKPSNELKRSVDSNPKNVYDTCEHNLTTALNMVKDVRRFVTRDIDLRPPAPQVFVVSWLDYCAKYGMGFAMTDGTVSVHFNDSVSLALAPGKKYFDHIEPDGHAQHRRNYPVDSFPPELKTKVYLLHRFESYMMSKLYDDREYSYVDTDKTRGMVYVERYLRMKHVILFRLSNGILQFNFYDHTKLILSRDGLVVSMIDRHYNLRTWSLEALLHDDVEGKERSRMDKVLTKVEYARGVLAKIRGHGGMSREVESAESERERETADKMSVASRASSDRLRARDGETAGDRDRDQGRTRERERERYERERERERERAARGAPRTIR